MWLIDPTPVFADPCQPSSQPSSSSKGHFTGARRLRRSTRLGAIVIRQGRLLVLGMALAAAACGGGEDAVQNTEPTTGATASLPTTTSTLPATTTTTTVATTTTTVTTTTTTTMAEPTVADLYAANCAACHGADLEGGEGPALGPGGHAFGHADSELVAIITNGKDAMPAFADVLTGRQIVDLVAFIRSAEDNY